MRTRAEIKTQSKAAFKMQIATCILSVLIFLLISGIFLPLQLLTSLGLPFYAPFIIGALAALLLVPALQVGLNYVFLQVYTGRHSGLGCLFSGFEFYGRNLVSLLVMGLILLLWFLLPIAAAGYGALRMVQNALAGVDLIGVILLIAAPLLCIPGIIQCLGYSMTPYILADSSSIKALAAVKLSKRITSGYKAQVFLMGLSFIGWGLLCSLPMALGPIFLALNLPGMVSVFGTVGALVSIVLYIVFLLPYMYTAFAGLYLEFKQNALENGTISAGELLYKQQ